MSQPPIACSLTTPELRERRRIVLELLRRQGRGQRPLPNGYRLRFEPSDDVIASAVPVGQRALADGYRLRFEPSDDVIASLAALIETERACCPFLSFQLIVEPDHGSVSLELTGPAGTREFLEAELGLGPDS